MMSGESILEQMATLLSATIRSFQDVNIVFLNVPAGTPWGEYFDSYNNLIASSPDYTTSNHSLVFFITPRAH